MIKQSTPEAPKTASPLKILLIGPPGSHKTTFGLQWPDLLVGDCDRNLDGPDRWLRANGFPNLKYSYDSIRYNDAGLMREIEDCYGALVDSLGLIAKEQDKYKIYRTYFLDSLSHVNEFIIRHVLRLQNKAKKVYEMEARDWSPFKSFAYILLVSKLEQINKTVLCSCHEVKLVEPDGQNIMKERVLGYEPFFQGKVGDIIGAFFTDVWRLEVKAGPGGTLVTELQTTRHPKCEHLKNSVGMPATIELPKGKEFATIEPYLKGKI